MKPKLAKSETPLQHNPDTHREKKGGNTLRKTEPGTIRTRPSVLPGPVSFPAQRPSSRTLYLTFFKETPHYTTPLR